MYIKPPIFRMQVIFRKKINILFFVYACMRERGLTISFDA